ncbi:MAG TPA: membrane protein insertase YidC [Jiangellaceae bacterium]
MDTILAPLLYLTSWILIGWHWLLAQMLGVGHDGVAWLLAIIGLVVVIRILLIPLFVRQIKAQRNMQILQPKVRELQKKYKGDRERLQKETMKLYQDAGTNPFASCLPILLQAPFLFALFRVLHGVSTDDPRGAFTNQADLFESFGDAEIFGAPLSASFLDAPNVQVRVIAVILVVLMVATTYITQRQIMRKNMPPEALEGPYAQQQKILLYVLPLVFAFSGTFFPLGVVIYWLTSNVWTMGQQLFVIRRMPAPGSPAEAARKKRKQARSQKHGEAVPETVPPDPEVQKDVTPKQQPVRQQPKRQSRAQRKGKK